MFRLFGPPQKITLRPDEVMAAAEEKLARELSAGRDKTRALRESIIQDFGQLSAYIESLKKKNATGFTETVKNRFCENARRAASGFPEDWHSFAVQADKAVAEVSKIGMTEFRHLHTFRDDMTLIASKIRSIESALGNFKKTAEAYKLVEMRDLERRIGQLQNTSKSLSASRAECAEIDGELPPLVARFEELEKKKDALKYEKRINHEAVREAAILRQRIASELPVGRILKRLIYSAKLSDYDRKSAELYVKDPVGAFLDDKGGKIKHFLELAHNPSICDSEDIDRIEKTLRKLDFLVSLRSSHDALMREMKEQEDRENERLAELSKKRGRLESEMDEVSGRIAKLRDRKKRLETDIRTAEESLSRETAALESFLSSAFGIRASIVP